MVKRDRVLRKLKVTYPLRMTDELLVQQHFNIEV